MYETRIRSRNPEGVSKKCELVKSERNHDIRLLVRASVIGHEVYSKKKTKEARTRDEKKTKRRDNGSFAREIRLVGKRNP